MERVILIVLCCCCVTAIWFVVLSDYYCASALLMSPMARISGPEPFDKGGGSQKSLVSGLVSVSFSSVGCLFLLKLRMLIGGLLSLTS